MDSKSINFKKGILKEPVPKKITSSLKLIITSLKFQLTEYFNNSTLHGVRYIAEPGRPFGEKLMWFSLVATGVVSAFVIIANLWEKFQTNPTITGLDTDLESLQIFFPSIYVCPNEPFTDDRVTELTKKWSNTYEPEQITPFLHALTRLSYQNMDEAYNTTAAIGDMEGLESENLRNLVFEMHIECREVFADCMYKGVIIDCCDVFVPVYSERGFCFGFNARIKDTNDTEKLNDALNDIVETDKQWALNFSGPIRSSENMGFDFHSQIAWDTQIMIEMMISMKRTYTTDDARQLSIKQRQCIFHDEVKFQYYPQDRYSFTSCMKECRIKKSLQFCKCLPPFYRPEGTFRSCGISDLECLAKRARDITNIRDCEHCELSCDQTVFVVEKIVPSSPVPNPNAGPDSSPPKPFVKIEFLTWPIIQYKREVLFGWVDLLVSFGGIAGLFLGFSLLSGVEIVYYFTMRALCMLYKNKEDLNELKKKARFRPPIKYDLSLKPKFRHRQQVDHTKTADQTITTTLKTITEQPPVSDEHMQRFKRYGKHDGMNAVARKNMFQTISVAPYSRNIKPLDKQFKHDLEEPIFLGYLP